MPPADERVTFRQFLRMLAPIALLVGVVWVVTITGSRLFGDLDGSPQRAVVERSVIRPGNGPAIAATFDRARIVSTACWLSGPIEVVPDERGSFRVMSGGEHVHCLGGRFREGFTLRWPAQRQPRTRPA
jgi:hypothetical protein